MRKRVAMFKVPAGSVQEYFRFDPAREEALRELDAVIRAAAPALSRWFAALIAGLDYRPAE
jgi:hypothetical protein